jgi:hypothetical protein
LKEAVRQGVFAVAEGHVIREMHGPVATARLEVLRLDLSHHGGVAAIH